MLEVRERTRCHMGYFVSWLEWYAIGVTLIAVAASVGWYLSHDLINCLKDIGDNEWPLVRQMLQDRL